MASSVKRQKRVVLPSSDDEEAAIRSIPKPVATWSGSKSTGDNIPGSCSATQLGPHILHKEHAAKSKPVVKARTPRPISFFFRAETQAQHLISQKPPEAVLSEVEGHEDLFIEDSPIEDLDEPGRTMIKTALDRRKKRPLPDYDNVALTEKSSLQGASRKFKILEHAASISRSPGTSSIWKAQSVTADSRPWAEKYGPGDLEELMVHKRKISDVRNWLDNALRGHTHERLLILKGPSGAGKTATVSMLAKAMGFDVSEWKNPIGTESSSEAYSSMSAHFDDFLYRSGKFSRLALADKDANASAMPSRTIDALKEKTKRTIILMEEFPNTFLSSSTALRSFRTSVRRYLALNTSSVGTFFSDKQNDYLQSTPLVMIITETRLATSTTASDSFTAHRLLGPEILSHRCVSTIEFNPVASTYLTKALDLVIQKEARQSGRRRVPGQAVLKKLGEVGDVRSAIGSLEFLCLRGGDRDDWGGRVASRARQGANISSILTKLEKDSLEMITQRESTVGLFHAVGKVIHNKRDDIGNGDAAREPPSQPPNHLSRHARPRLAQVSANQLINETGTDVETFIAALHENFVLSCSGKSFTDNLDGCMEILSDSDILGSSRGGRHDFAGGYGARSFEGTPSDALKQHEICFHVAVRGLLFTLPDPVQRRPHPISGEGGVKNDTYRMFYPTSIRLSRQTEEIDDLVDRWIDGLRADSVTSIGGSGWQSTQLTSSQEVQIWTANIERRRSRTDQNGLDVFRMSLGWNRKELILERLPYVTKIEQHNAGSTILYDLERITKFNAITTMNNEEDEDEDGRERAPVSDRVIDNSSERLQHGFGQATKAAGIAMLTAEDGTGQLFLSDDDIEDD